MRIMRSWEPILDMKQKKEDTNTFPKVSRRFFCAHNPGSKHGNVKGEFEAHSPVGENCASRTSTISSSASPC